MWVDDRGRLLGRWNLLDVFMGVVAFVVVGCGVIAWRMLQTAPLVVQAITPVQVTAERPNQVITLIGSHFRPFYRATVGDGVIAPLTVENPSRATLTLPPMAPGAYDLAIYNETEELTRIHHAIIAWPQPVPGPVALLDASGTVQRGDETILITVLRADAPPHEHPCTLYWNLEPVGHVPCR